MYATKLPITTNKNTKKPWSIFALIRKITNNFNEQNHQVTPSLAQQFSYALPDYLKQPKYIAFTMHYIALAAKLALSDGPVNEKERLAFLNSFSVPKTHLPKIDKLFNDACLDTISIQLCVSRLLIYFPGHKSLFNELLSYLINISAADEPINNVELDFIKSISQMLYISESELHDILRSSLVPVGNANEILKAPNFIKGADLSRLYRDSIKSCHPDFLSQFPNIAKEYQQLMAEKFYRLTVAYEELQAKLKS